jgi:predicted P-loop ATPase
MTDVRDFGEEKRRRSGDGGDGGDGAPAPRRKKGQWTIAEIERELKGRKIDRLIARDEMTMFDMLLDAIPGRDVGDYPRVWSEDDTTAVGRLLAGVPMMLLDRVLKMTAGDNGFNPLIQCFEALPQWDGVPRNKQFLPRSLGLDMTDPDLRRYNEAVSERFAWGLISRGMQPGVKFDSMLILEGRQGIGKSRFCRALSFAARYFTDSLPPLTGMLLKDAREALIGKLVVEMGELAQFKGSRVETLKTFLATEIDTVRLPYLSRSGLYPRSCVFIGTTNETEYLNDVSGNRRFWPVQCGRIDMAYVAEVRDQVYAEALVAWREANGRLQLWLPDDIEIIAAREQGKRMKKSEDEPDVVAFINELFRHGGPVITSAKDFLREQRHWTEVQLSLADNPNARAALMGIADIMRGLGGEQVRTNHSRLWKFRAPIASE